MKKFSSQKRLISIAVSAAAGLWLFDAAIAEIPTQRIDIQVDGERPLAGERSRFAVAPNGEIYFTYTLAAGEFECKPLGVIDPKGEIRLTAIDSESTWNVDGWGTYGFPFDLATDGKGNLHVATRHRGQPYGVDYWSEVDGVWRLESFGAGVTFGGNNVALGILPDGSPVVVCLSQNRTQLAVWERDADGNWTATRPPELHDVVAGHFDLVVHESGDIQVFYCPSNGGPVSATRDSNGVWIKETIADRGRSRWISATINEHRVHVSYVANGAVNYASINWGGAWDSKIIAEVDDDHHALRTDISAAAECVGVVWERGIGAQAKPKDYGGAAGAVSLAVIESGGEIATHELVSENAGRPSVALTQDGKAAWVGVYTGNDAGDDFYLLQCALDGELRTAPTIAGDAKSIFRDGCLKDIGSGNAKAENRGFERIDFSTLTEEQRFGFIDSFLDHDDPRIRRAVVVALAADAKAHERFSDRLSDVLNDPDGLVRKSFIESIVESEHARQTITLAPSDPMIRISSAEVLREHHNWFDPRELDAVVWDLGDPDSAIGGAAGLAMERLIAIEGVGEKLQKALGNGNALQRVRAALVLSRTKNDVDLGALTEISGEQAQLALCGLLGQVRAAEGVPILRELLQSEHPRVRSAAVFALRSTAFVSEVKPVAKHPKGFDLLALRVVEPKTPEEKEARELAIAALEEATTSSDANVRQKAVDALVRVEARQSEEALIDLDDWRAGAADRHLQKVGDVYREPTEIVDGVVQVGSKKQLFIDDFVIDSMEENLERRFHAFEKHPHNPVFHAQQPWEEGWADPFMSTVIYDPTERCFKMWYRCGPRHSLKAYAVSEDGVNWLRPNIARESWQEFEEHNLLGFDGEIATWKKPGNNVLHFPAAAGEERFLSLFYQPPTKDYAVSRSADGINWTQPQSVRQAHGDVVSLTQNPATNEFLFFPKYMREHQGYVRRSFAATTLESIDSPFAAKFPFLAEHRDDARVAHDACRAYGSLLPDTVRLSEFHSEIYSVTAMPYEGLTIALYNLWPVIGNREGPLDMPMKMSRDMETWTDVNYPNRALSIGEFGEWDSGMVYGGNTMIVVDNKIWLYYLGANMGHCTKVLPTTKPYHALGVGLATMRLDGFASLGPNGEFTTKLMKIDGQQLQINGRGESIRVELQDADGKPIPGFAAADCDPIEGDDVCHTVTWKGSNKLPNFDEPIRLRVVLDSAEIFAFRFQ